MSDFPAHSHQSLVNYCERCGTVLTGRQIEGKLLPACPACDHIGYLDPKVAAGVIFTLNGELVLLKRGIEHSVGKWVCPGGYVDRGEPVPVAAAREAREEVGMEIAVEDLIGVYSYPDVAVVLIVYSGTFTGGELKGNFESQEVRTFGMSEIPWDDLAFRSTAEALKDWIALCTVQFCGADGAAKDTGSIN